MESAFAVYIARIIVPIAIRHMDVLIEGCALLVHYSAVWA